MSKQPQKFTCKVCKVDFPFEYYGTKPPFHPRVVFLEDIYAIKDPFYPDPKPLCLGSKCTLCGEPTCVNPKCSLFYTKRFCLPCVRENMHEFPDRIQQEVQRQN
eukprot:Phypoly_transcript_30339.p1 GENE.Phypoly_transcript_30339~~Phypoly_transcript_30339.p1  ORF type:complete len:104 (+),score=8.10 Phypoly_transcript_30339:27-338(+)